MKSKKKLTREQIVNRLHQNEDVLRKHRVKRIGLFGSYAKGRPNANSDIDFIVEFDQSSFDNYMNLTDFLEKLFDRKVDILTPAGIRSIRIKKIAQSIRQSVVYV